MAGQGIRTVSAVLVKDRMSAQGRCLGASLTGERECALARLLSQSHELSGLALPQGTVISESAVAHPSVCDDSSIITISGITGGMKWNSKRYCPGKKASPICIASTVCGLARLRNAHQPYCWPSRVGMVKKMVAPFPGSEVTQMRPPWRSTIFLHVARPMPVP